MKSWKIPTPEQADRAVANLGRAEYYRYFFDKLENPEWIEPLRTRGFFSHPPSLLRNEKNGVTSFPPWPESRFLARMASKAPELVANVILAIPDTENVMILEDYSTAVLNMPPEVAARLVAKAKTWICSPYRLLLPEKLAQLISSLAEAGQIDNSLDLAQALLEVIPDSRVRDIPTTGMPFQLPPEPRAHIDEWDYEQILKDSYPALLKADGKRALRLLCELLNKCTSLSQTKGDDPAPEDYSTIWRPAIEDIPERKGHDLRDVLISGVRDAADYLVRNDLMQAKDVIQIFRDYRWSIFGRLSLHTLASINGREPALLKDAVMNEALRDDYRLNREYALLIEDAFPMLCPQQQERILKWIEIGPDINEFKNQRKSWSGKEPSDEEATLYQKRWQCERFGWISKYLDKEHQKFFGELKKDVGEPRHPRQIESVVTWVGPFSPKTANELREMAIEDIVKFMREWTYPGNGREPSPEGLSRILSHVVAEEPEQYAEKASSFKGSDPTYVRALVSGLTDAAKKNRAFVWDSVLELCVWVVEQPREIPGRSIRPYSEVDADWGGTRKAIAELLSSGCCEGPNSFRLESRKIIWSILEPLTDDPNPTPEDELRFGGSNMDPITLSINTTRGEALHAVMEYALWIKRNLSGCKESAGDKGAVSDGTPEVKRILDRHLDIATDPSLAIRAVYGQWFNNLVYLDADWAASRVEMIFPREESLSNYFDAAWGTYIVFSRPYDGVLEILIESYAAAINRLEAHPGGWRGNNPEAKLAEHLMVYYWRGKLVMDASDRLFSGFWEKGSPDVRAHALEFIGQVFGDSTPEEIPEEVMARSKSLWEWRISVAREAGDKSRYKAEMERFGSWFICGKFDMNWALQQLLESLRISEKTKPDDLVVAKLAEIVNEHPKESVECLKLIIQGDEKGWLVYRWRDSARLILEIALRTEAASIAESIINHLGSRGYHEFRNLL